MVVVFSPLEQIRVVVRILVCVFRAAKRRVFNTDCREHFDDTEEKSRSKD